jgi:ribonuclease VapC
MVRTALPKWPQLTQDPLRSALPNWAETLFKVAELGRQPSQVASDLEEQGLLHGLLEVAPLTADDAVTIGELRPITRDVGLSLGARACLALGMRLGLPVVTADRSWAALEHLAVEVQPIRT